MREKELSETVVNLQERVETLTCEFTESKQATDDAEAKAFRLGDALSAAKEQLDDAKRKVLATEKQHASMELALEREKDKRAQAEADHKAELTEMNAALAKLDAKVAETAAARSKETSALREELRSESRLRSECESSFQENKHSAEGLRFEIDQKSDQILFLTGQLEAASEDEKKASASARAEKTSLTQQLQEARRDLRKESKTRAEAEAQVGANPALCVVL